MQHINFTVEQLSKTSPLKLLEIVASQLCSSHIREHQPLGGTAEILENVVAFVNWNGRNQRYRNQSTASNGSTR